MFLLQWLRLQKRKKDKEINYEIDIDNIVKQIDNLQVEKEGVDDVSEKKLLKKKRCILLKMKAKYMRGLTIC